MKDHIIVCGYGRIGVSAFEEIRKGRSPSVIVENDPENIQRLQQIDCNYVEGDATSDDVLIEAGVKSVKWLLAALPNDSNNVYVVLTARNFNPDLTIVARAQLASSEKKLLQAGADKVVLPNVIGGKRMIYHDEAQRGGLSRCGRSR